jgi:hypothetical protein
VPIFSYSTTAFTRHEDLLRSHRLLPFHDRRNPDEVCTTPSIPPFARRLDHNIDLGHLRRHSKNISSGRSSSRGNPSLDRVANPTARPSYRKISFLSPPVVGACCCDPTEPHRILQTRKNLRTSVRGIAGAPVSPPDTHSYSYTLIWSTRHAHSHAFHLYAHTRGPRMFRSGLVMHMFPCTLHSPASDSHVGMIFIVNLSMDRS